MLTSRELVNRAIRFQGIDRLPHEFPEPWGNDYYWVDLAPSPDDRRNEGPDDWGVLWRNRGHGAYLDPADGHVLSDWSKLATLRVPDIKDERRWVNFAGARERAGDRFVMAHGFSIYERVHMLRGIEDTWCDITESPDELCRLLDLLVEMNLYAIQRYATLGVDGFIFNDDWGLQDRLMIRPAHWRSLWKPRYARIFGAARAAGLHTFLHSCGYIVDILYDLIEVGLEVIHMDQQENMGLELLGKRFGGRITFFSPVDIQKTMVTGTPDQIRAYCRQMVKCLARPEGGFLPRKYADHVGAGHTPEAIKTMCDEFMKISDELYPTKSGG
jgi:uroporphyrinogen decarboxylase